MARQKGTLSLASNIEPSMNAPLDGRSVVNTVADLTASGSFPYFYEGMIVSVKDNHKIYQLIGNDPTSSANWEEVGSGGGGGGTSDYNDLTNKPQIDGVTLSGNKTLSSFGLTSSVETQSSGSSTKSYVSRGEKYDWNTGNTVYGTCSTSASTTAKSVTLARGTLNFTAGAKIAIKFSYTNTASAPTLTINGTVKNIKYIDADGNVSTPLIWWNAGDVVEFTYDGTQWLMQPTMQMLFSGQGTKIPRESIYSTTEKVVGCWTDGRPVYQKTIETTTPTTTTTGVMVNTMISTGISNIRQVVRMNAYTVRNNSYFSIPMTIENSNRLTIGMRTSSASPDPNKLSISNGVAEWSNLPIYVTVQYTKTTDSANSFKYGDPNEYSTTEKIVGTWIDGKPLYQKTVNTGALPNNTQKTVSHGLTGTYRIVSIEGIALNTTNGIYTPMVRSNGANNFAEAIVEGSNIRIETTFNGTSFTNSYVTLKYTKS